jgi:hypothetical protein
MSQLEERLQQLSKEFAYRIVAALADLSVDELFEELESVPIELGAGASDPKPPSEVETSILEHLNEAGPTGSTVRAWVISTQGELPADEHADFERQANEVLAALEERGVIQKRGFSKSRGDVYAVKMS